MITGQVFEESLACITQHGSKERLELWDAVAQLAQEDVRVQLSGAMSQLSGPLLVDLRGSEVGLVSQALSAALYCLKNKDLYKDLDVTTTITIICEIPTRLEDKELCVKCVKCMCNVGDTEKLSESAPAVIKLLCYLLSHKFKSEQTVQFECLRLIDKMLFYAADIMLEKNCVKEWLLPSVVFTTSAVPRVRERALDQLTKHWAVMVNRAQVQVSYVICSLLITGPKNPAKTSLLTRLIDLATKKQAVHAMRVWTVLLQMVSKDVANSTPLCNELLQVAHAVFESEDANSQVALLNAWCHLIDCFSTHIPAQMKQSKRMLLLLTPITRLKRVLTPSVQKANIRTWWYLATALHNNDYNVEMLLKSVIDPMLRHCFTKHPGNEVLLELGGHVLALLLDLPPPQTDLRALNKSPLNMANTAHAVLIYKNLAILIKEQPKRAIILPILIRLCRGDKGQCEVGELLTLADVAKQHMPCLSVLAVLESLHSSHTLPVKEYNSLAEYIVHTDTSADQRVAGLTKLLKSARPDCLLPIVYNIWGGELFNHVESKEPYNDIFAHHHTPSNVNEIRKKIVWESSCVVLIDHLKSGESCNEGSSVDPKFTTVNHTLTNFCIIWQNPSSVLTQLWGALYTEYIQHACTFNKITSNSIAETFIPIVQGRGLWLEAQVALSKILLSNFTPPELSLLGKNSYMFGHVGYIVEKVLKDPSCTWVSVADMPGLIKETFVLCDLALGLATPSILPGLLSNLAWSYPKLVALAGSSNKVFSQRGVVSSAEKSLAGLFDSVLQHLTFFDQPALIYLEPYIITGLEHSKKSVRTNTGKFWNCSFGKARDVAYSERLSGVLRIEAKRCALVVPNMSQRALNTQSLSQAPETVEQVVNKGIKGSFLKTKQATKTDEVASTSAKRSVLDQVSRDYVPISTSPKKQKVLTRHQKEVKEKKRKERNVPMMYNSLDMNSQEPFAFSQDSRSQDAASPIKAPVVAAPASPVTPFSSRRLLFLSPSPAANKLKTSNLARSIALIPVSSPDPPSSPLNTDDEVLSQDSDEDIFKDIKALTPTESDTISIKPSEETTSLKTASEGTLSVVSDSQAAEDLETSEYFESQEVTPEPTEDNVTTDQTTSDSSQDRTMADSSQDKTSRDNPDKTSRDNPDKTSRVSQDETSRDSQDKTSRDSQDKTSRDSQGIFATFIDKIKGMVTPVQENAPEWPAIDTQTVSNTLQSTAQISDSLQDKEELPNDATIPTTDQRSPDTLESSTVVEDTLLEKASISNTPQSIIQINDSQDTSLLPGKDDFDKGISSSLTSTAKASIGDGDSLLESSLTSSGKPKNTGTRRRSSRLVKRYNSEDAPTERVPFKKLKSCEDFTRQDSPINNTVIASSPDEVQDSVSPAVELPLIPELISVEESQLPESIPPHKEIVDPSGEIAVDPPVADVLPPAHVADSLASVPEQVIVPDSLMPAELFSTSQDPVASQDSVAAQCQIVETAQASILLQGTVPDSFLPQITVKDPILPQGTVQDYILPQGTVEDSMLPQGTVEDSMLPQGTVQDSILPQGTVQDSILPQVTVQDSIGPVIEVTSPEGSGIRRSGRSKRSSVLLDSFVQTGRKKTSSGDGVRVPDTTIHQPDDQGVPDNQYTSVLQSKEDNNKIVPSETGSSSRKRPCNLSVISETEPIAIVIENAFVPEQPKRRGRGRPKKVKSDPAVIEISSQDDSLASLPAYNEDSPSLPESQEIVSPGKRKRGRPKRSLSTEEPIRSSSRSKQHSTPETTTPIIQVIDDEISVTKEVPSSAAKKSRKSKTVKEKKLTRSNSGDSSKEEMTVQEEVPLVDVSISPLPVSPELSLPLPVSQELSLPLPVSQELSLPLPVSQELSLPLPVSQELSLPLPVSQELSLPNLAIESVETPAEFVSSQPPLFTEDSADTYCEDMVSLDPSPLTAEISLSVEPSLATPSLMAEPSLATPSLMAEPSLTTPSLMAEPSLGDIQSLEPSPVIGGPRAGKTYLRRSKAVELAQDNTLEEAAAIITNIVETVEVMEEARATEPKTFESALSTTEVTLCEDSLPSSESSIPDSQPEDVPARLPIDGNTSIPDSQPTHTIDEISIPDSQPITELSPVNKRKSYTPKHIVTEPKRGSTRALRRKRSIAENLDEQLRDLAEVEKEEPEQKSTMEKLTASLRQSEACTPPRLPLPEFLEESAPPSPRTPTSILRKTGTPASEQRVTFAPLPEGMPQSADQTTPKRLPRRLKRKHGGCKASNENTKPNEAPVVRDHTTGPFYPSLIDCSVAAADIIRSLCTGVTISSRHLSIAQITCRNIRTVGDLARLSVQEVEELPIMGPKVIQLKRHLKKYENTQSASFSFKLFGQKSESIPDSLETPEVEDSTVTETVQFTAVPVESLAVTSSVEIVETPVEVVETPDIIEVPDSLVTPEIPASERASMEVTEETEETEEKQEVVELPPTVESPEIIEPETATEDEKAKSPVAQAVEVVESTQEVAEDNVLKMVQDNNNDDNQLDEEQLKKSTLESQLSQNDDDKENIDPFHLTPSQFNAPSTGPLFHQSQTLGSVNISQYGLSDPQPDGEPQKEVEEENEEGVAEQGEVEKEPPTVEQVQGDLHEEEEDISDEEIDTQKMSNKLLKVWTKQGEAVIENITVPNVIENDVPVVSTGIEIVEEKVKELTPSSSEENFPSDTSDLPGNQDSLSLEVKDHTPQDDKDLPEPTPSPLPITASSSVSGKPLVDYPSTQERSLVDYPLTQDMDQLSNVFSNLSTLSDSSNSELFRILEQMDIARNIVLDEIKNRLSAS